MSERSLCDICRDPGACCRAFLLQSVRLQQGAHADDAAAKLERVMPGAPFEPIARVAAGAADVLELWSWRCPKLTEGGRCSIYETRPIVCRNYEAGSSGLCSMSGVVLTPAERAELGTPEAPAPLTVLDRLIGTSHRRHRHDDPPA